MKGRVALSLLALAGLAIGIPGVVEASSARAQGTYVANGAESVASSLAPALGLWLLLGAVGIGISITAICLIRRGPVVQQPTDIGRVEDLISPPRRPDPADRQMNRARRRESLNRQSHPTSHDSTTERHVA